MMAAETETIILTIAQCALQIDVSQSTVMRWIEGGHLAAFCPPGKSINDGQRGPKALRVFKADWENFLRARTMTGTPIVTTTVSVPTAAYVSRTGQATGTDGITRCKRKKPR